MGIVIYKSKTLPDQPKANKIDLKPAQTEHRRKKDDYGMRGGYRNENFSCDPPNDAVSLRRRKLVVQQRTVQNENAELQLESRKKSTGISQ